MADIGDPTLQTQCHSSVSTSLMTECAWLIGCHWSLQDCTRVHDQYRSQVERQVGLRPPEPHSVLYDRPATQIKIRRLQMRQGGRLPAAGGTRTAPHCTCSLVTITTFVRDTQWPQLQLLQHNTSGSVNCTVYCRGGGDHQELSPANGQPCMLPLSYACMTSIWDITR